ncbi:MAG TPA: adenylate/guanylate cyclase domain-containing protein, partial [Burkholderiaceae bacterium]|nr:adenylate/guanylate cyclase domain-containing protein [Burkholderiaceae bacterium]
VLRGDASEEELAKLKGALVLVGTSALGLADLRTIPLQTGYPGVEAHANVLDTILQGALGFDVFYYQPDWEPGATLLLLIVSGAFLAFYLPRRTPPTMIVVSLAWLLLVLGSNAAVWWHWHLALPLALPVITVVALALLNIIAGFLITNRQKHAIQNLFGEYVPPAYVERMVANPTVLSLEGEQREMTVLFADVRNFTALSESLSATELKDVLNRYLSAITQVIFEHQGTIDKYVGDLVMAFWNAPLDDPEHAKHAVEAALAMQKRMVALRDEFAAEGLPEFHIGIGLNTGTMNVGDMGSRYRRAYTVLGDSVNLASRLESLCPFYGVPILVSEQTRQANPEFLYLPIDLVRVKGRREAVELFQPLSFSGHASEFQRKQVAGVETFLRYYRSKQWQQAQEQLATLLQNDPNNNAFYAVYKARLAHILASKQTPADFPVFSHEQK